MSNRFQIGGLAEVWDRLRSRGQPRTRVPSTVTALDLDGTTLRVVQCGPRGGVAQVFSGLLELPAEADRNDPGVMGAAVARALAKLKLKPGSVVMGVPRARAVLRTLVVPVIDKIPELASMVHFQVGRDLPFRIEEAVLDFKVCRRLEASSPGTGDSGDPAAKPEGVDPGAAAIPRLEVLVAAVKKEVVDYYRALAVAAGLELDALGLLPYANARCMEACRVADGDATLALVSLRPDEVGVDIIARQTLLFSRGAVLRGSTDPAGAPNGPANTEALIRNVVIEVVRSLHGHSGLESSPPAEKIVVAGATGHEADVVAALSARLSTPCTLLDPATALDLPKESQESAAGAIGALGLALGAMDGGGLPFDFLKPKRPAVQRDLRRIWALGGVVAAALVVAGVLGLRSTLIQRRTALLDAAAAELADAEKKRPVYRKLIAQTAVIEEWIKGDRDWLQQYAYLTSILPPSEEIYVTSLAISGQGSIRLAVQARSGETLARLDRQLRAAGYDVKPLAITPGADRFGYEFRSNVELILSAKQKIDLHRVKPAGRPIDDVSMDPAAYRRGGGG